MKFSPSVLLLTYLIGVTSSAGLSLLKGDGRNSKITLPNTQQLDDDGNVLLAWEVDFTTEIITFEIEAKTTAFVGFGISPQGGMVGADIFIAGVADNGTSYYSDRFATATAEPQIDKHSDWTLINATETGGVTYLKFSRALDTCDNEDYPITADTNRLIWSMGETDKLEYHKTRRGSRSVSLLGAKIPEINFDDMISWEMTTGMAMPIEPTTYWCSFHKGPVLQKKHHIVAFDAVLENADALMYTHHFILYNCFLPANSTQTLDEVFGNFTVDKDEGSLCYGPNSYRITNYCSEYLFVWAIGGKTMVMPEKVGYPIAEGKDAGLTPYYMLEIHYDNPEQIEGLKFKTGAKFYYTDNLRPIDAGLMTLGHQVDASLTVPPDTEDFIVIGHCSPTCTEKLKETGIDVFNVLLHSHLSGRRLKLRHFRKGVELPWIDFDDHYDFDYQQNKPLVNEVKVLPGDHIIYECTYSSTWKKGEVVSGGLTTNDEMCQAFVWYYPKNSFDHCSSQYPIEQHFTDLGVTKWSRNSNAGYLVFNIDEPAELRGDYIDVMSHKFNWTTEFKTKYMDDRRYGGHTAYCKSVRLGHSERIENQKYPEDFTQFVPEDKCSNR